MDYRHSNWKGRSETILFTDDKILYVYDPQKPTRKLRALTSECSQVAGCKSKASTLVVFPHTSAEQSNMEMKKAIPLTTASKRRK